MFFRLLNVTFAALLLGTTTGAETHSLALGATAGVTIAFAGSAMALAVQLRKDVAEIRALLTAKNGGAPNQKSLS